MTPDWFTGLMMALLLIVSGGVVYYYNELHKKLQKL